MNMRHQATGDGRQATGDGHQATGDGRWATGDEYGFKWFFLTYDARRLAPYIFMKILSLIMQYLKYIPIFADQFSNIMSNLLIIRLF